MNFDFMEPPDRVRLVKSLRLLFLIGALDADGKLTPLGEQLVFVLVWDLLGLSFQRFTLKLFMSRVWCPADRREDLAASPRTSVWTCFSGGCRARLRFRSLDACHVFMFSSSDVFITMSFVIISVEETGAKDLGFHAKLGRCLVSTLTTEC